MAPRIDTGAEIPASDSPLLRKFGTILDLTRDEAEYLRNLQKNCTTFPAQTVLFAERDRLDHTYIVRHGWGCIYKLLPDGRRQILNLCLPGDFIGLYSSVTGAADHSAAAITELETCRLESDYLLNMFQTMPRLGAAVCWSAACNDAILEEHVVRVGRRSAYERIAHILVELYRRWSVVSDSDPESFQVPFSQEMLADTLGLTPVHVNRTLSRLRRDGLITVERGRIRARDLSALAQVAGFDQGYLNLEGLDPDIVSRLTR